MNETKRKFPLVDALIAVLLAAGVIAAIFFFVDRARHEVFADQSTDMIIYTVTFRGVSAHHAMNIAPGDKVVDSVQNTALGVVESVECFESENEELVDITRTIRTALDADTWGYSSGGVRIAAGRTLQLRTRGFSGSGLCTTVEVEEGL